MRGFAIIAHVFTPHIWKLYPMKILTFVFLLCSVFEALACQKPPVQTEQDFVSWKSQVFDSRKDNGTSIILDIAFPIEFNEYQFTGVRLFKGNGVASNEFILPISTTDESTVRAMVGKELIEELSFAVTYSDCGYIFHYKISQ